LHTFVKIVANQEIQVQCSTTVSETLLQIELHKEWAPLGCERFLELVSDGYFSNAAFFRVVKGFLVQFGIAAEPSKWSEWYEKGPIEDDTNHVPFKRGYLSFAGSGPNSRTTELFVAYSDDNSFGSTPWETPFGVVTNMDILDKIYDGYGDVVPFGSGPDQQEMYKRGNSYLRENFPKLDFIVECTIVRNTKSYTEVAQLPTDQQIDEGGILSGRQLWLLMFIGGCIAAGMVIKYQKSHLHGDKIL